MHSEVPESGRIVSEFANDPDMAELVESFVSELPDRIRAIQDACDSADLTLLATLVHQLKGAAGGYGFPSVTEASAVLEASTRARADLAVIQEQLDALVGLCRRVQAGSTV